MALTPEQIDVLYMRNGLGKFHLPAAPLQYEYDHCIHDFARAIEAAARRDALEEAAKVCESIARDDYGLTKWHEYAECAAAIRKLKEDTQ